MRNLPEARVARLAECHTRQKAGYNQHASPFLNPPSNGKLVEFMLYSQKNGFSDATTNTRYKILRLMAENNVNLADPEAVRQFIATRKEWSNGHKQIAVSAYTAYARMEKIE